MLTAEKLATIVSNSRISFRFMFPMSTLLKKGMRGQHAGFEHVRCFTLAGIAPGGNDRSDDHHQSTNPDPVNERVHVNLEGGGLAAIFPADKEHVHILPRRGVDPWHRHWLFLDCEIVAARIEGADRFSILTEGGHRFDDFPSI